MLFLKISKFPPIAPLKGLGAAFCRRVGFIIPQHHESGNAHQQAVHPKDLNDRKH